MVSGEMIPEKNSIDNPGRNITLAKKGRGAIGYVIY